MSTPQSPPDPDHDPRRRAGASARDAAQLSEGLKRLASSDRRTGWRLGSRFRNAFFTGLVIVGPVTITLWIMWGVIHWIDAWIKLGVATGLRESDITSLVHVVPGVLFAVDAYVNFARSGPINRSAQRPSSIA